MTTDAGATAPGTGMFLHGRTERLATRLVNVEKLPTTISWYRIHPGGNCTYHVHRGKDECWLIVEGNGRARVGQTDYEVSPGDMLVTHEGTPHALENDGSRDLVFVNIVFPTGGDISSREVGDDGQ